MIDIDALKPFAENLNNMPKSLDLTIEKHLKGIESLADTLHKELNLEKLINLEESVLKSKTEYPLGLKVALKLSISKSIIKSFSSKAFLSITFAMYNEHNRIKSNEEHEHGENFLIRKVHQLNWLLEGSSIDWELILVDDGCPNKSGEIAKEIIKKNNLEGQVEVLFLKDAIDKGLNISKPMKSTADSQKGGAVAYGMWHAAQKSKHKNHIIIFTDADLSTHLGQSGMMIEEILNNGKAAAIGSRREKKSVVVKQGARNDRGKLFIYIWKRMLPQLNYIVDTQCGFKGFRKELVDQIIENLIEKKFAFDIELLLRTELIKEKSVSKIPLAWIDSESASTTTDLQPYLPMLKSVAKMYRKYLPVNETATEFADYISNLSEENWQKILEHIPDKITSKTPDLFATYDGVSTNDLETASNS
jgi:glycosyltransferase involved in cell wall biosynthesis